MDSAGRRESKDSDDLPGQRLPDMIIDAQNSLCDSSDEKEVAGKYARLLATVPGITSCKVCLGNSFAKEGSFDQSTCNGCWLADQNTNKGSTIPKDFRCQLETLPGSYVFPLDTVDHRFGFFALIVGQADLFESCKPYVENLGNFASLTSENLFLKSELHATTKKNMDEGRKPEETEKTFRTNAEQEKFIKKLTGREQMFRALVENSPDIIARYNLDGMRIYVNPVYVRESKISEQELLAVAPVQRSPLSPDTAKRVQDMVRTVIKSGVEASADIKWNREDGEHWYNLRVFPEFDQDGKIVSVMSVSRDITERKLVEVERLRHLWFFESLDRVNRAIQGTDNMEEMIDRVFSVILSVFNCDRVCLLHPVDEKGHAWGGLMKGKKPEYNLSIPSSGILLQPETFEQLQMILKSGHPVTFGSGNPQPVIPDELSKLGVKSQISLAIFLSNGKPRMFGLQQCSHTRTWTADEKLLFHEAGCRVADRIATFSNYENLLKSEQRYRMVFENSPVSIWEEDCSKVVELFNNLKNEGVTDLEAYFEQHPTMISECAGLVKIVDVNKEALLMHAAGTKQELMDNLANIFTPESFETFKKELVCIWNGKTEMVSDAVVKDLRGGRRHVTVYFSVCQGHEENFSKVLVSLTDITDRVHAEAELRQNESRFRSLYNNTPVMLHSIDQYGRLVSVSDFWLEKMGYSREEVIGHKSIEFLAEESRRYAAEVVLPEFMVTGECTNIEYQFVRKDGVIMDCLLSAISESDDDGHVIRSLAVINDITDRKRAESALQNTAKNLNEAQRLSHIGSWELDLEKNELDWSDEIYRIFEIDPEKFGATYEAFLNAIHPEDRDAVNLAYTESLKTRRPYDIEHRLLFPDGRVKYVHEQCETFYVGDKPVRSIGSVQDITERRLAEEALRDSEWRYREIFDNVLDGLYLLEVEDDDIYRMVEVNPAFEKISGLSRSALAGTLPDDVFPPTAAEIVKAHQRRCVETGQAIEEELLLDLPSGQHYFHSALIPARDNTGKIKRIVGIFKDITERRLTEEALRKSEQRKTVLNKLATIFLTIPDEEMYSEIVAVVLDITQSKFGLFGFINENGDLSIPSLSHSIWTDFNVKDRTTVFPRRMWGDSVWGRAIREKRSFVSSGPFHLLKGYILVEHFVTVPIVFGNRTIGLISFANKENGYSNEDIGLLKDIARFISPILNARLQRDRQERVRKIAEEELIKAKERAEEGNRLKTAFLQNISHEIRTPMNAIYGFSELLRTPGITDEERENYLSIVQNSSDQLLSIVSDILTISSIDTKQEKINIQPINIHEVINELVTVFEKRIAVPDVQLRVEQRLKGKQPEIYADQTKLIQVLTNLLTNAVKFTHKGFIEIGYSIIGDSEPCELQFYVKDTGIGIKDELHEKIFERFRQADETIRVRYGGTGLGLPISKGLVELLGGRMWVQSEPGVGTTFYFTIPYTPVN